MKLNIFTTPTELGKEAAAVCAEIINTAIARNGNARIVLSTGASQFETINALIHCDIDWNKVEMFHLDEYIGLPESHPASFRKYLKERFLNHVNIKQAYLDDGEDDPLKVISYLTEEIRKAPIDLGVIGIGENAHIAFNDPPADFETVEAYICVTLDDACKQQQVREGWFATLDDVPKQAISMTVHQIMQCSQIVSCVPYAVKAKAVRDTLESPLTNLVPATMLKQHPRISLFLDNDSASLIDIASSQNRIF
ncbi:MAG: glucosamine-6-phosphate deaminase [Tannerella sp.]|jgi:glucosamine-6-phosphate deaminase|nr:glucosamine-6-phosphate deaminase [Tannerella sp.]